MSRSVPDPAARRPGVVAVYFALSYLAVLASTSRYFSEIRLAGWPQTVYLGAVWISYAFVDLLPAILPIGAAALLLRIPLLRRGLARARIPPLALALTFAVIMTSAIQVFLHADLFIYRLYGFHVNGFVANLVFTPGGIESLGSSEATTLTFVEIGACYVAAQALLVVAAFWIARRSTRVARVFRRRTFMVGGAALLLLGLAERAVFAVSDMRAYSPVLVAANTFPFYVPLRFDGFFEMLGVERADRDSYRFRSDGLRLRYPREEIRRRPDAPRHNVVWLVAESLRWDMVTPEIMPRTHEFAGRSAWFRNHLSSGNGTRMGVFGMFYGVHGPYWFPFLAERRGPVLMDVLIEDEYQLALYTSARFSYPEFDSTVFAAVPSSALHERTGGRDKGWKRDRKNVAEMLEFLEERDPARPFMTFLFFESPHARYYFPPESVIREPYADDLNYATMDVKRDAGLIFNRYVNACHHLDSQIGRILDSLAEHHLLDDTIVVITGDHGEEFNEHGRWGHNSDFVREQIQVPLVLHVPGREAEIVDRLTSHLDIPATVLGALGVENAPEDYSLGHDLFGDRSRADAVVASWNDLVYVDDSSFAVLPLRGLQMARFSDRNGGPLPDPDAYRIDRRPRFLEIMKELRRFTR